MSLISLYIGAPLEYESERSLLGSLYDYLTEHLVESTIFANVTIDGRQLDFVLATKDLILVLEAKGYRRPIKASNNGDWFVRTASGAWKSTGNGYVQARDGALALRDAMRRFNNSSEPPYPSAAVVFVPEIPPNSESVTGDYKVSLISLSELHSILRKRISRCWELSSWSGFAESLGLKRVSQPDAAIDKQVAIASDLLDSYKERFTRTYSSNIVSTEFNSGSRRFSSEEIVEQIVGGADVLLSGASGCGKSLTAIQAALQFSQTGGVGFIVSGSDFRGELKDSLKREAALLGAPDVAVLFKASKTMNQALLIVVDGYNECPVEFRGSLTRSIAAIARIYEAGVVITSQIPLLRSNLLNLETFTVQLPSDQTKLDIARHSSSGNLHSDSEDLIRVVTTGLEAHLVGTLERDLPIGKSRFALFDAFVRMRLSELASNGIQALVQLASIFTERCTFSISERDFDRICTKERIDQEVVIKLLGSGLLNRRRDRVSFLHELFLHVFAAESILRKPDCNAESIINSLSDPRNAMRREFIVGSIDDEQILEVVLENLTHVDTILAALNGRCGVFAREWLELRFIEVLREVRREAERVRFNLSEQGWDGVAFDRESIRDWTEQEQAVLVAINQSVREGKYLAQVLDIVKVMDDRIEYQLRKLSSKAKYGIRRLRDACFANTYSFQHSYAPGTTMICANRPLNNRIDPSPHIREGFERAFQSDYLSQGQIYFLLQALDYSPGVGSFLAPHLVRLLQQLSWNESPYHLRLQILQSAERCCWGAPKQDKQALIYQLEALPTNNVALNGCLIDALQALGALDDEQNNHFHEVEREVKFVVNHPDLEYSDIRAHRLYTSQFDHPFCGVYYDAIQKLEKENLKTFLELALRGAGEYTLFLSSLISDLASFGDINSGELFLPYTEPPKFDSSGPQETMENFVMAHLALGRIGYPIQDFNPAHFDNISVCALKACGQLLYWSNRGDLSRDDIEARCAVAIAYLQNHDLAIALDVFRICDLWYLPDIVRYADKERDRQLSSRFPELALDICRHSLKSGRKQNLYFRGHSDSDQSRPLQYAIKTLSLLGSSADLPILRRVVSCPELGEVALEGIRCLEDRLMQ